jgi:hypothetical protein
VAKTLQEVIYQCRWVDGIKNDPAMVSDKEIARVIQEHLDAETEYEYGIWHTLPFSDGRPDYSYLVGHWDPDLEFRKRILKNLEENSPSSTGKYKLVKRRKAGRMEDV